MKILITGAAGFIGYSFSNHLLKNKKLKVIGIDNLNNYYDPKIKKSRLRLLKKNKNFKFLKIDICNIKKIDQLFKKNKFDFVFHFAAQAGVRYSIRYPRKYLDANINGFYNILESSNKNNIKRLFYASSSSVYGENKNYPLNEKERILPKNMYALSKKINEEISSIFNNYYKLKLTGLRFFTVYGEWGRPDMMMLQFISSYYNKKEFKLFNYGNHERDFTYIGDVIKILDLLLKNHKKLKENDVYNICSNRPVNLIKIINFMKKNGISPKIKKVSLQQADILKTHGDNNKILGITKFKNFINWQKGIKKTISWYKEFSSD